MIQHNRNRNDLNWYFYFRRWLSFAHSTFGHFSYLFWCELFKPRAFSILWRPEAVPLLLCLQVWQLIWSGSSIISKFQTIFRFWSHGRPTLKASYFQRIEYARSRKSSYQKKLVEKGQIIEVQNVVCLSTANFMCSEM
jgi:hypothetical protein